MESHEHKVPDGGYGWLVVVGAFFIHFFMDGITYAFGVFMPSIIRDFNTTRGKASIIGSFLPGFTFLFGPLASMMADSLGCRKTAVIGACISGIGLAISSFSRSLAFLYFSVGILTAFGFSLAYLPCMVLVNYYFEKRRGLAIGISVCGTGIGTFVFSTLSGFLIRQYNWSGAFLVTSAILFNEIPAAMLMRPAYNEPAEIAKRRRYNPISTKPSDIKLNHKPSVLSLPLKQDKRPDTSVRKAFSVACFETDNVPIKGKKNCWNLMDDASQTVRKHLSHLKNPCFFLFLISNFLTSLGFNAPYIFLVDYAINEGFDPFRSDFLVSILGISSMVGRFIIGYISDKECVNRLCLYNWCLVIAGIACILEPLSKKVYALHSLYSVVFGLFSGGYVNLTSIVCCDLLDVGDLSNSFGLVLLFQGIATLIGPPLCGLIYDRTKSYTWSFVSLGIAVAVSGLMLFVIPCIERQQRNKKEKIEKIENLTS